MGVWVQEMGNILTCSLMITDVYCNIQVVHTGSSHNVRMLLYVVTVSNIMGKI